MPELLIRKLSAETIEGLKKRARQHRRSLQGEVVLLLEDVARRSGEFWNEAEKMRTKLRGKRFSDSAKLIREDRER